MLEVEIDPHSGFCGGVIRAIGRAEEFLSSGGRLYSLGAIVHNEEELSRLSSLGLVTIDKDDLEHIPQMQGETLLIRAHGEPPKVYEKARGLGFNVIDCTCPMVLNIQKSIREAEGRVLIFGKHGHPEVLGLVGQKEGAVVFETALQLEEILPALDAGEQYEIFSQTTMSPVEYARVCGILGSKLPSLKVHQTICSQVASRHKQLGDFALRHDVVVFVSGKTSSNGKVLCDLCRSCNIRTYHISGPSELQKAWFRPEDRVGICGATSTPGWLLEKTAGTVRELL